ncbi:MAG: class I SAM-dependent methyltransferase [Actinobacteria bacterium]|nr:class I SAM-dependent methyltransferase [Actinomycetota bacterium]
MNATPSTSAAEDWSAVAGAWDDRVDFVDRHSVAATVLELAAGPGSLAPRWSQLVGADGSVVISDLAPSMVQSARQRTAGLPNVDVALLDASQIDGPPAQYDVVVSRMGLMFTPDPAVALGEIRRVLRDGGRFAALTWAGIEHNPWMTCVGMAAMLNGVVAGGPPVGPGGIFSLGDPAHVSALTTDAGFVDVVVDEIPVMFESADLDLHIRRVSSLAGPLAAAFAAATDEQLAAVRATAAQLAAPHIGDDGVRLPGKALLVAGRA